MPSRSVNPDILFNTIKEDQENGTSKASEMLKQAFPGVGNSCDDLASLFGQALMQDDSDKVSLVVTAPPSFSINARTTMNVVRSMIEEANSSILITGYSLSSYFADLVDIIIQKSQSGVFVKFFVNDIDSQESFDKLLRYKGRFLKIYNYKKSEDSMAAFNINTHGSENEKLPGKVYKTNQIDDLDSFDKSTFGKKGKQLVLTKKDKKVVVVYDLIKVDITPGCDYAQDKAFISTYAYGYLIHIYKFEDEKGNKEWLEWKYAGMISDAGGVYFTPYFLNGDELCMLLVNTKWIRFEKYEVNEDNYLFRLNDSLTSDIRKSASDNIARVGIPCV